MVRALVAAAFALAWFVRLPWPSPWLSAIAAFLLFLVPGVALGRVILREDAGDFARQIAVGFTLSTAVTGVLGLAACLFRLPPAAVSSGLFAAGLVFGWRAWPGAGERRPSFRDLLLFAPILATGVLAARWALLTSLEGDSFTYLAQVRFFQQSPGLSFEEFVFRTGLLSPPRFWLAFWPLSQAVLCRLSGLDPFELMGLSLAPFLAFLSVLSVFTLARLLGLPRGLAGMAAPAHLAGLLLLLGPLQPGRVFFRQLVEDKMMAAFVIAPVFFALVVLALDRRSRRACVALAAAGVALVFAHPTIMGVSCVIAALHVALTFLAAPRRDALRVLAIVLVLPVLPASFRFLDMGDNHKHFEVGDRSQKVHVRPEALKGLRMSPGSTRYALDPRLYRSAPFVLVGAAAFLALFRWRGSVPDRFVLASSLVVATALIPHTAWLLGRAITPFHLWRVLWLVPFGIAAAAILGALLAFLRRSADSPRAAFAWSAGALSLLPVLAYTVQGRLPASRLPADWQRKLHVASAKADDVPRYAEMKRMGEAMDGILRPGSLVVGDLRLNHWVPALSVKARPLMHRGPAPGILYGGFPARESSKRVRDWLAVVGRSARPGPGLAVLDRRGVQYLLVVGERSFMSRLLTHAPARFREAARAGTLRLYEVLPPAGAS